MEVIAVVAPVHRTHRRYGCVNCHYIEGGQKNWHTFFVRLNFVRLNVIKYWPIFKLISLSESGEHFNNSVAKDIATPQICRYTTL